MIFESKYNQGDIVFPIYFREHYVKTHKPCLTCDSTGEVDINGESFTCPKCKGYYDSKVDGIEWYTENCGKVGRIEIRNYRLKGRNTVSYMLDETGIDSGRVYDEDNLFYSLEEAEKMCSIRTHEHYRSKEVVL